MQLRWLCCVLCAACGRVELQESLSDTNTQHTVLNRGVALEALNRFEEACADYRAVLAAAPEDPSAWNNLGNASAGKPWMQQLYFASLYCEIKAVCERCRGPECLEQPWKCERW